MMKPDALDGAIDRPARVRDPVATIARIRKAATQEFGKEGFNGGSMQRIAKHAGVSKQIVYHYFSSKTELYKDIVREMSLACLDVLTSFRDDASDEEVIRSFLESLYDIYRDNWTIAALTFDQNVQMGSQVSYHRDAKIKHDRLVKRLHDAVVSGQSNGTISPKIAIGDFEFMSILIMSACATSRPAFAKILDTVDLPERDDAFWKDYAVSFVMRAIRP